MSNEVDFKWSEANTSMAIQRLRDEKRAHSETKKELAQYKTGAVQLRLENELKTAKLELSIYIADMEAAAGELFVDIPEPGSDIAKLLHANIMMRRYKIPILEDELSELKEDFKTTHAGQHQAIERADELEKQYKRKCAAYQEIYEIMIGVIKDKEKLISKIHHLQVENSKV